MVDEVFGSDAQGNGSAAAGSSDGAVVGSIRIVDAIPNSQSGETAPDAEPSLGVNSVDPTQIIISSFGRLISGTSPPDGEPSGNAHPSFKSTNGGLIWSEYGELDHTDTTIAWQTDGSAALAVTMTDDDKRIDTYSSTTAANDFGSPISMYTAQQLDQPWVRTGPSGHVYVAFNQLDNGPKSAALIVSNTGGTTYQGPIFIDRVGAGAGQDAPSVRVTVTGSTAYAAFTRWNAQIENDVNGSRFQSQVVVVRSDNGGTDSFTALGGGGNGSQVAAPISVFANTDQGTPLTLGKQRGGSDLSIAVDPNNAQRVFVAYTDAPGANGSGQVQLAISESIDAGATWSEKYRTPVATRSAQSGLAVLSDGTVGMLYDNYDPATDRLSQHLLTTVNDFSTTRDITLASESNKLPPSPLSPYLGDYFDLTAVGNKFYGIFSASNIDNGTDAQFLNASFNRQYDGTPGTASFNLTNNGSVVASSIDPYFFNYSALNLRLVDTGDVNGDGQGDIVFTNNGEAVVWLKGTGQFTQATVTNAVMGAEWNAFGTGDFDGSGTSDLLWTNGSGQAAVWLLNGAALTKFGIPTGQMGAEWQVVGTGDFSGDGKADIFWTSSTGNGSVWTMNGTSLVSASQPNGHMGQEWRVATLADINGDGKKDVLWVSNTGNVAAWLMNGSTLVGFNGNVGQMGTEWTLFRAGDFNGDGTDDLVWVNRNNNVQIWYMNNGAIGQIVNPSGRDGTEWKVTGVGDFTGAGTRNDILWRTDDGSAHIWAVNGTQVAETQPTTPVGVNISVASSLPGQQPLFAFQA